jgi:hypothetical protein
MGEFQEALTVLLGKDASGLSASTMNNNRGLIIGDGAAWQGHVF